MNTTSAATSGSSSRMAARHGDGQREVGPDAALEEASSEPYSTRAPPMTAAIRANR